MRLAIFSHVAHFKENGDFFAYGPYIKEINIWGKFSNDLIIVANQKKLKSPTDLNYDHENLSFKELKPLNFTNIKDSFISAFRIPSNLIRIAKQMYLADHIHIRCPGNIGMLALFVQVFFPKKPKTIKYAGNWDPRSKQPLSYRIQKLICRNDWLTRNAKVLVYGNWNSNSRNIVPFFTASYSDAEKSIHKKNFSTSWKFVFVGSLNPGKRPLLAIEIIQELIKRKFDVTLDIYGEGVLYDILEDYIERNQLKKVNLKGAQNSEIIKRAYKEAHFSILPSRSEGWPKAIAEAMFYACVPIATEVSCIPWMLDSENRGILIKPEISKAVGKIIGNLKDPSLLEEKSRKSQKWAQIYTLEKFENEISSII